MFIMSEKLFLINHNKQYLERGNVIQIEYNINNSIFLLLSEDFVGKTTCRLIELTGYKAGLTFVILPIESLYKTHSYTISIEWLNENYDKWLCLKDIFKIVIIEDLYSILNSFTAPLS
jgi:hypothetical protein